MSIIDTLHNNAKSMAIPIIATVMALSSIGQAFAQNGSDVLPKGKPAVEQNAGFKLAKTDERIVFNKMAVDTVKSNFDSSLSPLVDAVANTSYTHEDGSSFNLIAQDTGLNEKQIAVIQVIQSNLAKVERNISRTIMNQSLPSAKKLEITPVDGKDVQTSIAALSSQERTELNNISKKYTPTNTVKLKFIKG